MCYQWQRRKAPVRQFDQTDLGGDDQRMGHPRMILWRLAESRFKENILRGQFGGDT